MLTKRKMLCVAIAFALAIASMCAVMLSGCASQTDKWSKAFEESEAYKALLPSNAFVKDSPYKIVEFKDVGQVKGNDKEMHFDAIIKNDAFEITVSGTAKEDGGSQKFYIFNSSIETLIPPDPLTNVPEELISIYGEDVWKQLFKDTSLALDKKEKKASTQIDTNIAAWFGSLNVKGRVAFSLSFSSKSFKAAAEGEKQDLYGPSWVVSSEKQSSPGDLSVIPTFNENILGSYKFDKLIDGIEPTLSIENVTINSITDKSLDMSLSTSAYVDKESPEDWNIGAYSGQVILNASSNETRPLSWFFPVELKDNSGIGYASEKILVGTAQAGSLFIKKFSTDAFYNVICRFSAKTPNMLFVKIDTQTENYTWVSSKGGVAIECLLVKN